MMHDPVLRYGIPEILTSHNQPVLWLFETLEEAYQHAEPGDAIVDVLTNLQFHVTEHDEDRPYAFGGVGFDGRAYFDQRATVLKVTDTMIFLVLDGGHHWVISHIEPYVKKGDRIAPGDLVGKMLPSGDL